MLKGVFNIKSNHKKKRITQNIHNSESHDNINSGNSIDTNKSVNEINNDNDNKSNFMNNKEKNIKFSSNKNT